MVAAMTGEHWDVTSVLVVDPSNPYKWLLRLRCPHADCDWRGLTEIYGDVIAGDFPATADTLVEIVGEEHPAHTEYLRTAPR